jgi:hypothetical protein
MLIAANVHTPWARVLEKLIFTDILRKFLLAELEVPLLFPQKPAIGSILSQFDRVLLTP